MIRGNRLELPCGSPVVLGQGDTSIVILPYRVSESGIQALLMIFQAAEIFSRVALRADGDVVV